jgi:signal transduction histidine kinase
MTDPDRSLMDRLEQEYDLRGRTLRVIIFSALLYTCFILLDWFYTPATFYTFLLIRLVVLAVHGVLYIILRRIKTNRGAEYIAITLAVVDVAGISIMIQILGGFETAYVQGLYLIIMGIVVVVPLRFRTTIILYALIWASYAIPGIFRPHGIARGKEASTNLFFLTAVVVLGVLGSYIMEVIRKREFAGRVRLEEATAKLQESNEKLKTLDQVKMQFFANVNHELRTPLTLMLAPLSPMIQERMGLIRSAITASASSSSSTTFWTSTSSRPGGCGSARKPWISTITSRASSPRSRSWPTRKTSAFFSSIR